MTSLIRRAILALAMIAGIAPALAQVPAAVPALPDSERRTSYSLSASTCACAVNFAIFGEGQDYGNWIEVWVNGVNVPQFGNWSLTSPSPGTISNLPRPITDAVLTFNVAQTGTVQIVGARRPRRTTQFAEGQGVPARNLNQAFTDIIAMMRENWDKTNDVTGRAVLAPPGETLNILAAAATRANSVLGFDAVGNLGYYNAASGVTTAANVNFLQGGTGAVSRTVQDELRDTIKAAQFGMKCDGVTNDSAALQAAQTFSDAIGGPTVMVQAGTCVINNNIFQNKWSVGGVATVPGMKIRGQGKDVTKLDTRVAGGYAISVSPDWKAAFVALSTGTVTTTGGLLGASGPVGTLGAITSGSLYTNGTYNSVALTGGAGTGATANITVSGAAVTAVTLVNPGSGYAVGNTLSATAASIGGTGSGFSIPIATMVYNVQFTMNDPLANEVFVTLPKSFSVTTATSRIALTLPFLNTGYTYNIYNGTAAQPVNYATVSGLDGKNLGGNQNINVDAIGSAHAVPVTKVAAWQNARISDLSITNTTAVANASGVMLFKAGYAGLDNVVMDGLTGNGLDIPNYTGDIDGSFNVSLTNSRFNNIAGTCVNAAGLRLELSNLYVSDTIFNLCGTLPVNYIQPQNYGSSGFTVSTITNATTPVVTTSVSHTLSAGDQVYLRAVAGMTLADGWYRACGTVAATTYQLCDLNGNFIDTTALGAYTASSGRSMLAWRPPSVTSNSGALVWMGLIGTFRNLDFTQNKNFAMYFTEAGSSDNATIENVDFENTYGKGLYAAAVVGGSISNSECLSAVSAGPTISCVQLGTGAASGGASNFQIKNIKVRSDVVPATGFEQFKNTNNAGGAFADSVRPTGITWQAFAGATRLNGFTFDPIPGQVRFSVSALNTFKLAPTGVGCMLPLHLATTGEWVPFCVPDAGITFAVSTSTPSTTYNIFVNQSAASTSPYTLAVSATTSATGINQGYSVLAADTARTFVGTATTDGSGNFQTTGAQTSRYPVQTSLPVTLDANGIVGCPSCVLISGTAHGDSNYSILSTDRYVYTSAAFTAPRTWTLPAANSLAVGTTIWVQDAQNTVGSTNTLTVQRAGADLINNFSSTLVITGPSGGITFTTDGVSNWGVPVQTVSTGGTGRQTLTNHGVLVGATANPITQLTVGTNGQLLAGATGADPAFVTASQDCTLSAAGAFTCTKTNNVSFAAVATSGSATDLTTGTLPAARLGGLSAIVNSIGGNVALSNTGLYFDGPSVAQGATGTWFASGTVSLTDSGGAAGFSCKLWDGTNVISSARANSSSVGLAITVTLSGVSGASPPGNLRISCQDSSAVTGLILANTSGLSKDSTITAFRIN